MLSTRGLFVHVEAPCWPKQRTSTGFLLSYGLIAIIHLYDSGKAGQGYSVCASFNCLLWRAPFVHWACLLPHVFYRRAMARSPIHRCSINSALIQLFRELGLLLAHRALLSDSTAPTTNENLKDKIASQKSALHSATCIWCPQCIEISCLFLRPAPQKRFVR